jgi:hypothetical protein
MLCATDLGSRLGAVCAVAKAVSTLTQRGEIGPSVRAVTVFCATDLGSRPDAVLAVAKAVAMLTHRDELRPSASTATGIGRRTAGWTARGHTATQAATELRIPVLTPRVSA